MSKAIAVTAEHVATIQKTIAYAEAHPSRIGAIGTAVDYPAGRIPEHGLRIGPFRITYSISETLTGTFRHLSLEAKLRTRFDDIREYLATLLIAYGFRGSNSLITRDVVRGKMLSRHFYEALTEDETKRILNRR